VIHRFAGFEIDPETRQLRRGGETVELQARVFDLLCFLVRHRDRVVSRDELLRQVWSGTAVADQALRQALYAARQALGDDGREQKLIRTVRGRGFRFVADAAPVTGPGGVPPDAARGACAASALLPFVGRANVLAELRSLLAGALGGQGFLALLAGEAGIGKTRTAEHFAAEAAADGVSVFFGRCDETPGSPEYWPWVQILRRQLLEGAAPHLEALFPGYAADVTCILPELEAADTGGAALSPAHARFRLFDSLARFWRQAASLRPMLLVLDDLHAADLPTLELLRLLAQELRDARLLLVATYRDAEMHRDPTRSELLGEILRGPSTRCIELEGLSPQEVGRFVESVTGRAVLVSVAAEIHDRTGGNPYFLTHLVPLLGTGETLEASERSPGLGVARLPRSLGQAIARQLDGLPRRARDALRLAAVIGREFSSVVLERASDLDARSLLELLGSAVDARVLQCIPGDPAEMGRHRFTHLLVRDALYQRLGARRRAALHRKVGLALESIHGTLPGAHLTHLAHHFLEAAAGGEGERAIRYALQAASWANQHLAWEEAVRHYCNALAVATSRGSLEGTALCDLLLDLAEAQTRSGDRDGGRETVERAAELARRLGCAQRLARAALILDAGLFELEGGVADPAHARLLEQALAAVGPGDSALRARLVARLAVAVRADCRERARELSHEAMAMAKRVGDPVARVNALNARALVVESEQFDPLAEPEETLRLAEELDDPELVLFARISKIGHLMWVGDLVGADREIGAYEELAARVRQPQSLWYGGMFRATQALLEGRFADAERLGREFLAIGERVRDANVVQAFAGQLGLLRWEQGRLGELCEAVASQARAHPRVRGWRCALSLAYAEVGRGVDARKEVERLAADGFLSSVEPTTDVGVALLAEVMLLLAETRWSRSLYDLLLPETTHLLFGGWGGLCLGSTHRPLGILAASLGCWQDAEHHFASALEVEERIGARPWVAHTRHAWAHALLRRNQPGDRDRAHTLLGQALETCQALGMLRLLRRVEGLLGGGSRNRRPSSPLRLTLG
jgi:DNA-binding winged helix-turn-helix (wHTH) protein/tetratricopeptide (TPR) repeat protein